MRLDLTASFDFDPNNSSQTNSMPISKKNEISANLESLSVERVDGWGWLEGIIFLIRPIQYSYVLIRFK